MSIIELTIKPDYVPSWGLFDSLRELFQNAMDAHDLGYAMSLQREKDVLVLSNAGVALERSCLLLGSTGKQYDDSQRGKFGEGLKLGVMVLCRLGLKVQIESGNEIWTPFIGVSDVFNERLLKISITRVEQAHAAFTVRVTGITEEAWAELQDKLLCAPGLPATFPEPDRVLQIADDKILLEDRHRNKLYSKGLYVGEMPDACFFGYDLAHVTLDRDRKVADPWSLRCCIANVMCTGIQEQILTAKALWPVLQADSGEARAVLYQYQWCDSDALSKQLYAFFAETHGADAVPVANMAESIEAAHYGLKSVMLSGALKQALEKEIGAFDERKKEQLLAVARYYGASDLTAVELTNLTWAVGLVAAVEPLCGLNKIKVVDFFGEDLFGVFYNGEIRLARRILDDRKELLATLVHETAHNFGADGSPHHTRALERIFAAIVCPDEPNVTVGD